MIGQDPDRIRQRYREYWNRENHDRPLVSAFAPREGAAQPAWPDTTPPADRWMDTERVIRFERSRIESTAYLGEAFPMMYPNLGPDFLGAVLGSDLSFGEATSWAHPVVEDWKTHPPLGFDPSNRWMAKMVELTEAAMADSGGDYLVGVTDLHPGMDALVSLRGPERLCTDLFDDPDALPARTRQVHDVFCAVFDRLHGLTAPVQGGTSNWMGLFHEGRFYVTSCDFAGMISAQDFETHVVPVLAREIAFLGASIYHLDGPGSLRHLDRLLAMPGLDGIQWVPGAGQKPMREWIPVLKKIQGAGKLLQVSVEPADLEALCESLEPEGVHFGCWFRDEQAAKDAIASMERASRRGRGPAGASRGYHGSRQPSGERPGTGNVPADADLPGLLPPADRTVLRDLAARWMRHAADPVMAARKRQWKALHDLAPERPMVLFETASVEGFVEEAELACRSPFARRVERLMRDTVRHAEELGDDVVVEPWYRMGWRIDATGFGVDVQQRSTEMPDASGSLGYTFNFPVKSAADVALLRPRTFRVDRELTGRLAAALQDAFGDILPVRVGNFDPFMGPAGDEGFCGTFFFGLTWQIYRFVGNDGLLYWVYDAPDALHRLMRYMTDDRIRLYEFLEREGLLSPNTDNQMAGPRAYGYVSALPEPRGEGPAALADCWAWAESQETTSVSPSMFKDFFLPYLAELGARFGLVYYGCCEPVQDRLPLITEAIPNVRSVSVSPWSEPERVAEMLDGRRVFSRKPAAQFLSGATPHWDLARKDMERTRDATRGRCVEILFRDLYDVGRERGRLAEWVAMTRSVFGM